MNMWCHHPTGYNHRHVLRFVVLAMLFVVLTTTFIFAHVAHAVPSTDKTINFQGRLLSAAGAVVPDGNYNMQFKIYQNGTGTAVGNPGGTLKWTESYVNNGGTSGVQVKNGFFSVSLGSRNTFGTSVDWDQSTLWLSMNIAGSSASCTTYGTAPCTADGEMLPMKRITATPYSINSGAVGGKTADNLVQLAQGVQTDASTNSSSIFINKTGSGNLIQLQNTATDVFTVSNSGNITLGNNAAHTISVANSASGVDGQSLTVSAGNGGNIAAGGDLILQGGAAGGVAGASSNGPNAVTSEDFEGEANGTVMSTSNTIFDAVTGNGSYTFSNTWSINGTSSGKFVTLAGAYQDVAATNVQAARWYMMIPSLPSSTTVIANARSNSTAIAQFRLANNGTVQLRNGSVADGVPTSPLPTNAPIRVEWKINGPSGRQDLRFYWGANLHGLTPNTTTFSTDFGGSTFNNIGVGVITSDFGTTIYTDEWAHGSDWIGPLQTTYGSAGNLQLDAGTNLSTGAGGAIAIGAANAGSISIGASASAITQNINIGTNNTTGSVTNVTIGSGGAATSGTTNIQARNSVSISTNGNTRATFSDTANTVYFGNGVSAAAPSNFTLQGTDSSATAVAGGSLTVQGGSATTGNANGGNVTLSGGSGFGTGVSGLVVLSTPTFQTVNSDANCYTSGANVAASCTITAGSVNGSSAIKLGFSATGRTATLPDPTITTSGRIMYLMASLTSEDFTLSVNGGGSGNLITMRKNTAATMIWNGADWISAGGSNTTSLQDAYTNTAQSAAGDEIILSNSTGGGSLTIRDNTTSPINDTLLEVRSSTDTKLFSVSSKAVDATELAADGFVNSAGTFTTNWTTVGTSTVSRITTDGQESGDSAQVVAGTTSGNGIRNKLSVNPTISSSYRVSVQAKLISGSAFTNFTARYSPDGGTTFVSCTNYSSQTVVTTGWTRITCDIATGATTVTNPYIYYTQPTAPGTARTFLLDASSFTLASTNTANVKIGSGTGTSPTLFTLDKAASAPTSADNDALLGSMYYDTTLGKVQCYEIEGWGPCGAGPDTFVTISPQYNNAVMNGTDIGTITSDLCSDTLNINDGSSAQPTICGTNETRNFYKWTSAEVTTQTRSIYVTYLLPSTFKQFVAGSTSLMGRTDSANSGVTYQVYKDHGTSGLTSCGSAVSVSTGSQTTWQKVAASGSADPTNCTFVAGDSILLRINLTSRSNANAYVSNIGFTFNNN